MTKKNSTLNNFSSAFQAIADLISNLENENKELKEKLKISQNTNEIENLKLAIKTLDDAFDYTQHAYGTRELPDSSPVHIFSILNEYSDSLRKQLRNHNSNRTYTSNHEFTTSEIKEDIETLFYFCADRDGKDNVLPLCDQATPIADIMKKYGWS